MKVQIAILKIDFIWLMLMSSTMGCKEHDTIPKHKRTTSNQQSQAAGQGNSKAVDPTNAKVNLATTPTHPNRSAKEQMGNEQSTSTGDRSHLDADHNPNPSSTLHHSTNTGSTGDFEKCKEELITELNEKEIKRIRKEIERIVAQEAKNQKEIEKI